MSDVTFLDGTQAPEAEADTLTLECSECGLAITGAARGRGSAAWKLSTHRYVKHGERSSTGKAKRASKPTPVDAEFVERPALGIVREISSAAGDGKRTPTADDLAKGLGKGLGLLTVSVASFAAETDPTIPEGPAGEQQREWLTGYLALSPEQARDVMRPIGKALAPTKLNRKYGKAALENVDVVASIGELVTLGVHWRRYFRQRNWATAQMAAAAAPGFTAPPAPAAEQPAPAPGPVQTTSPAPQAGVLLTPDMLGR